MSDLGVGSFAEWSRAALDELRAVEGGDQSLHSKEFDLDQVNNGDGPP